MYIFRSIMAGLFFGAVLFFVPFLFPLLGVLLLLRLVFGFGRYNRFGYGGCGDRRFQHITPLDGFPADEKNARQYPVN
jgi:hypothetical protein